LPTINYVIRPIYASHFAVGYLLTNFIWLDE